MPKDVNIAVLKVGLIRVIVNGFGHITVENRAYPRAYKASNGEAKCFNKKGTFYFHPKPRHNEVY